MITGVTSGIGIGTGMMIGRTIGCMLVQLDLFPVRIATIIYWYTGTSCS